MKLIVGEAGFILGRVGNTYYVVCIFMPLGKNYARLATRSATHFHRGSMRIALGLDIPTGLQLDCLHGLRTTLRYVLVLPLSSFS